jgi:hypothetical protein
MTPWEFDGALQTITIGLVCLPQAIVILLRALSSSLGPIGFTIVDIDSTYLYTIYK